MPPVKPVSLTKDPIARVLVQLVIPAFIAQLVFVIFTLTNTYFIGQLGTDELAVLGFTGTLGFFIQVLLMGIGNGTAVIIAHAIGRGEGNVVEKTPYQLLDSHCRIVNSDLYVSIDLRQHDLHLAGSGLRITADGGQLYAHLEYRYIFLAGANGGQ